MRPARIALIVGLALAMARIAEAQEIPAADFVIVPLRGHVLATPETELANCKLTDAEVARFRSDLDGILPHIFLTLPVDFMDLRRREDEGALKRSTFLRQGATL